MRTYLSLSLSMVSDDSTSRASVLPTKVFMKVCVVARRWRMKWMVAKRNCDTPLLYSPVNSQRIKLSDVWLKVSIYSNISPSISGASYALMKSSLGMYDGTA